MVSLSSSRPHVFILELRGFLAEYRSFVLKCDEGWLEYERACYFFVDDEKTALEAQRECEELNAHLVSSPNEGEKNFIGRSYAIRRYGLSLPGKLTMDLGR